MSVRSRVHGEGDERHRGVPGLGGEEGPPGAGGVLHEAQLLGFLILT